MAGLLSHCHGLTGCVAQRSHPSGSFESIKDSNPSHLNAPSSIEADLEKVEEARHAIDVLARTISGYIPERIESKHEPLLPADARTQS
jgi:hypothetical protein